MDAPRALVFRPLVKGNEALGTRLSNLNNRDLALSLDNINSNVGKMAGLLAKLREKPAPKERPPGLKR